jgi:hypothetical protein
MASGCIRLQNHNIALPLASAIPCIFPEHRTLLGDVDGCAGDLDGVLWPNSNRTTVLAHARITAKAR